MKSKIEVVKDLDKRLTRIDNLEALLRGDQIHISNQAHVSQVCFKEDEDYIFVRSALLDLVKVRKNSIKKELEKLLIN